MKARKVQGPQEPSNQKHRQPDGAKPKRTAEHGPLGFGSVMHDVRGSGKGGAAGPTAEQLDPALAQAARLDQGAQAAAHMGAVASVAEQVADASHGIQDSVEALEQQDRSPTQQAQAQPHVPTALGRMTPSALLETVLDEATRLELEQASKELHVELEPADLGPLVVRLRKGPDGSLDIGFRAREGDAARMLESGTELLEGRLADAGFLAVRIAVEHDDQLVLGH